MRKLEKYKYILFVGAGLVAEWIYRQIPDIEKRLLGVADLLDAPDRKITTIHGRKVSHIKEYSLEIENKDVAVVMAVEVIRNNRNHAKCREFEVFECGVGNEDTEKNFLIEEDVEGGKFVNQDAQGTSKLTIRRIDDMNIEVCGQLYIKMDIEGAELEALEGTKETIQKYKPIMAICLYHRKNDLVNIPLYINELLPDDYQFFLRGGYHTILWAIPEGM